MASYFASLTSSAAISNLGTRLNSLRRAITSGDEADDPENEDCSHISNVLRAYYTEKGRIFPPWLPPDPKAPAPPQPRIIATQASLQQGSHGPPFATTGSRGGGLGDLWGDPSPAQPDLSQTASLRNRNAPASRPSTSSSARTTPLQSPPPSTQVAARPLPSQRVGSYQTTSSAQQARLGLERTGSGNSAQDRLRARLQGSSSSGGSSTGSSPTPSIQSPRGGEQSYTAVIRPWDSRNQSGLDSTSAYGAGGDGGGAYPRKPTNIPSNFQIQRR